MELWDLLDKNRTPLGLTHPRGRRSPMPPHTYHTVVSVFTVDTQNRLLLTLRAPTKGMYPNYWEFTCGSGIAGENSLTSAHRELLEETGYGGGEWQLFMTTSANPTNHNEFSYDPATGIFTAGSAEGKVAFMLSYSAKLPNGKEYVLYSQPVTVDIVAEPVEESVDVFKIACLSIIAVCSIATVVVLATGKKKKD